MNTQQTLDYEMFNSILSNREVDQRHVGRLMDAISQKNLLHLNPIICNDKYEVIDGQHRLEAAKRLGVAVYYIIDAGVSKQDIATINSNAKNWSIMDYVNYWTIEKRLGFDKLSAFLSENTSMSVTTAISLLSTDGKANTKSIKEGVVDVNNYAFAVRVAEVVKEYRNIIDHAYERNFVLAVAHTLSHPDYNHDRMKQQLSFQSRSLVRCVSMKQYIDLLEEVYNRNASKNRISF